MVKHMKKHNNNESNQKRPLVGQIKINDSEIDFSRCKTDFSYILQASQLELKNISKKMLSLDHALIDRIIINIILFELEFISRDFSVILQVKPPLPMPTASRITPTIENAKRVTFFYREDLGLIYRNKKEYEDDKEKRGTMMINEIIEELKINSDILNNLVALIKQSKLLLKAISSAIVAYFPHDSYPYVTAMANPTGIITDFIHIHSKNIFTTFHPIRFGKLDWITIQVKRY